jgi:hypothetical protein
MSVLLTPASCNWPLRGAAVDLARARRVLDWQERQRPNPREGTSADETGDVLRTDVPIRETGGGDTESTEGKPRIP